MQFSDVCIGCWLVDVVKACDACSWIIGFSAAVISFATYCLWRLRKRVLRENQHIMEEAKKEILRLRNMELAYKHTEEMMEKKCKIIEDKIKDYPIEKRIDMLQLITDKFIEETKESLDKWYENNEEDRCDCCCLHCCTCTVPLKREKGKRKGKGKRK